MKSENPLGTPPEQSANRDAPIIELYFARDERAIAETDAHYGRLCMQVSMNILGPGGEQDAEECVSDAYLRLWDSIPPARPRSLCAYLCRIVRNLSINRLRDMTRARRGRDMTISLSELETCIPAPREEDDALPRCISAFLRETDELERNLFMGRYWYAMSVKDLAKEWDMSPNRVSVHLYRTRERLRRYLEERGYTI